MSYPMYVKAVICYIESHIWEERIDYGKLERRVGFSQAYIRELFRKSTGYSLAYYVKMRKIKRSAMELVNTDKTILEIACLYGFSNPETYTRSFRKITGMTPSEFRRQRLMAGKQELFPGVFSIEILREKEKRSDIKLATKKNVASKDESTILYGVPKLAHGMFGGSTFYPICLKACMEYLGEDIEYDFASVCNGAAFRFVWNTVQWDLSNIDLYHTFEESQEAYRLGAEALGREFSLLERKKETKKEEFMAFIREHIDEGYPCIALGIIGPPEPCLITGYRQKGEELLGWNFFQDDPEFAANVETDESGYFSCHDWWENTDTQAVMCIGPILGNRFSEKEIIVNGIRALDGRMDCGYSKGLLAYDAWKNALKREEEYTVDNNYSILFEKMLCQIDAMNCLVDGRRCAAAFFRKQAEALQGDNTICIQIADLFEQTSAAIQEMQALYGDFSNMEEMLRNLANPNIRGKSCDLIDTAKRADADALNYMKELLITTSGSTER